MYRSPHTANRLETRNAAQAYRKENDSDPTATPAPPQAARREQKRRAKEETMSGLIPHIKTTPLRQALPEHEPGEPLLEPLQRVRHVPQEDGVRRGRLQAHAPARLSICPDDWWGKWDEEREEGTFSGVKMTDAAATAGH